MKEKITKYQAQDRLKELKQEEQTLLTIINSSEQTIMDRIDSLDDIFREAGIDKESFYKQMPDYEPAFIALKEMELISSVLNEGTILGDNCERHFPYFNVQAGFVFDYSFYNFTNSLAGLGPRLCFKNYKLAEFAGRKFTNIYKKFYYNK